MVNGRGVIAMRSAVRTRFAAGLIAATIAGCRLMDVGSAGRPEPLDARVLEALRWRLKNDFWRQPPGRSLLRDTETERALRESSGRFRWQYDDRTTNALLARLDESPVNAGADEYLARLAGIDGISGWNAAVLLARRNPRRAISFAPRLERLVAQENRYDSETGLRTDGKRAPAKPSSPDADLSGADRREELARQAAIGRLTLPELLQRVEADRPAKDRHEDVDWRKLWGRLRGGQQPAAKRGAALPVSRALRQAAAEAWCRVLAVSMRDPVEGLAPAGRLLLRNDLPPAVRGELYRAVARHAAPAAIPHLGKEFRRNEGSRGPLPALRRAAMEACVIHARMRRLSKPSEHAGTTSADVWPATIHLALNDPDPQVRKLYGRWAALANGPAAQNVLESQLRDFDDAVRYEALRSLGVWGTDRARALLRERARSDSVPLRVAAAMGLSHWGAAELVPFLSDSSPSVRAAAARAAARRPTARSALLVRHLLGDSQLSVREECVRALAAFPQDLAVPLLLQAMSDDSRRIADEAWGQLRDRCGLPPVFPALADADARRTAVEDLADRFHLPRENPQRAAGGLAAIAGLDGAKRARYEQIISRGLADLSRHRPGTAEHQRAVQTLSRLDAEALPVFETLLQKPGTTIPPEVFDVILPKIAPVYAAVRDLSDRDPLVRQSAAARLAGIGSRASLSPLALHEVERRISARPDRVLWQHALRAVMKDAGDADRDRLAVRASQLAAPEVRIAACEYFRKHPRAEFGERILELMNDRRHRAVRLAAIEAAGFCRNSLVIRGVDPDRAAASGRDAKRAGSGAPPRRGLIDWLRSSDREVREAAAVSLARLGHDLGYAELLRTTFEPDARRREKAYRLMGETGQRRFVEHLIRRGAREESPRVQQAILQSLNELTVEGERPVGLSRESGYDARMKLWRAWLEQRRRPAQADAEQ